MELYLIIVFFAVLGVLILNNLREVKKLLEEIKKELKRLG